MDIYSNLSNAFLKKIPFKSGNYVGKVENGNEVSIFYYGSNVFNYNERLGTFDYDFCNHEASHYTLVLINRCLEIINAPFKVSCKKGEQKCVILPECFSGNKAIDCVCIS